MRIHFFSYPFAGSFYDESVSLRNEILRQPLGLEFTTEELAKEYDDIHFGVFNNDLNLLGCLVLVPVGDGSVKMRQVAIVKSLQGKGIGSALVKASEIFCFDSGYNKIVLNARKEAVSFYLKLGYKKIGDVFIEINIPHFQMIKDL